jgi:hypothetical protein
MPEKSIMQHQSGLIGCPIASRADSADLTGGCNNDEFVVSTTGEACGAPASEPNRKSRLSDFTFHLDLNLLLAQNGLDFRVDFPELAIIMKKRFSLLSVATLAMAFFGLAALASAHEHDTFKIGDKYYLLTVGSLNEPFIVDSISGVDLRVSQVAGPGGNGASKTASKGTPVTGLEQTLKVELAAGDKKKTLSFDPSDKTPGSYAASFIPTVQTTYSYRIFGTIDGYSVNLTFACVAGEVSETAEDNSQLKVSDTITRLNKVGAFGCAAPKKSMGFPEPALSSYELSQNTQNIAAGAQSVGKQVATAQVLSIAGIVSGLLGLAVAGMALKRK